MKTKAEVLALVNEAHAAIGEWKPEPHWQVAKGGLQAARENLDGANYEPEPKATAETPAQ